jgi:spoIIIJ-associated protein
MEHGKPDRLLADIRTFVDGVVTALGVTGTTEVASHPDGVRVEVTGDAAELLVRKRGEGLDALQHLVNSAYRSKLADKERIVVDALGFRSAKDNELRQMAQFLMARVRETGVPQEMGPLNAYARRVVHLEVAKDPEMTSESQGDGLVKQVIIGRRTN